MGSDCVNMTQARERLSTQGHTEAPGDPPQDDTQRDGLQIWTQWCVEHLWVVAGPGVNATMGRSHGPGLVSLSCPRTASYLKRGEVVSCFCYGGPSEAG